LKNNNIITIDGPSASGKGTLARNIADYLEFDIFDSGLLYRVYAFLFESGLKHSQILAHIKKDISFKADNEGLTIQERS
jgi:cytidylate kinase